MDASIIILVNVFSLHLSVMWVAWISLSLQSVLGFFDQLCDNKQRKKMAEQYIINPFHIIIIMCFLVSVALTYRIKATDQRHSVQYYVDRLSFQIESSEKDVSSETLTIISDLKQKVLQQSKSEDRQFLVVCCLVFVLLLIIVFMS